MDELIKKLEDMVAKAQTACARSLPNKESPVEYQWGRLQGRYAGLVDALKAAIDAKDSDEADFETGEA